MGGSTHQRRALVDAAPHAPPLVVFYRVPATHGQGPPLPHRLLSPLSPGSNLLASCTPGPPGLTRMSMQLKGGGDPEDTILEGVTRDSVIRVAKDAGYDVVETQVERELLLDADEAFTVGTAVVVSPIGAVTYKGVTKEWKFEDGAGPTTKTVYETLTGIQTGRIPDPYGWTVYLD